MVSSSAVLRHQVAMAVVASVAASIKTAATATIVTARQSQSFERYKICAVNK
jgi:hypothetical protein